MWEGGGGDGGVAETEKQYNSRHQGARWWWWFKFFLVYPHFFRSLCSRRFCSCTLQDLQMMMEEDGDSAADGVNAGDSSLTKANVVQLSTYKRKYKNISADLALVEKAYRRPLLERCLPSHRIMCISRELLRK